jgi:hypothetical protein
LDTALLNVLDDWSDIAELPSELAVGRLVSLFGTTIRPHAIAGAA